MIVKDHYFVEKLFKLLDGESLHRCLSVQDSWRQFIFKMKYFWSKVTRNHPGWNYILPQIDSDSAFKLGSEFIQFRKSHKNSGLIHPFFCAIKTSNLELLKDLITKINEEIDTLEFEIDLTESHHATSFAAKIGNVEILEFLHSVIGGDLNKKTAETYAPMHIAVKEGHENMVKYLLGNLILIKKFNFVQIENVILTKISVSCLKLICAFR